MIRQVTITNDFNESLTLELASPEKSGLAIKSIEGLGPSKSVVNITELVTSDISIFNSSRISSRDIVINLLYMNEPSVEDNRLKTYKFFPIKEKIKLSFLTDNREVYCYGYVESNKPSIFSKQSGCAITIKCPDPFFYATSNTAVEDSFTGIINLFSFPFFNDSLTENTIEMGEIPSYPEQILHFDGEYSTGIIIRMYCSNMVVDPVIYNVDTGERISINTDKITALTGSPLSVGDTIIINTKKGEKSVKLIRGGDETNIIACLRSFDTWFTLKKGENKFTYSAKRGGESLNISYEYSTAYEGI